MSVSSGASEILFEISLRSSLCGWIDITTVGSGFSSCSDLVKNFGTNKSIRKAPNGSQIMIAKIVVVWICSP
jgi:hypothetical protein